MPRNRACQRDLPSGQRNPSELSIDGPHGKTPAFKRIYYSKIVRAVTGMVVLAALAAFSYQVRELMAALLLFSVLFGVLGIVVLILSFLGRATHDAAAHLEAHKARMQTHNIAATHQPHPGHISRSWPWN